MNTEIDGETITTDNSTVKLDQSQPVFNNNNIINLAGNTIKLEKILDLDINPEMFQCNKCPFKCLNGNNLMEHINITHKCLKPIENTHNYNLPPNGESSSTNSCGKAFKIQVNIDSENTIFTGLMDVNEFVEILSEQVDKSEFSEENDWSIVNDDFTLLKEAKHTLKESENSKIKTEVYNTEDNDLVEVKNCYLTMIENEHQPIRKVKKNFDENNIIFKCNDCSSTFVNKEDVIQHIKVLHGSTKVPIKSESELLNDQIKDDDDKAVLPLRVIHNKTNTKYNNCKKSKKPETKVVKNKNNNNIKVSEQRFFCDVCNKEYSYKHWMSHVKDVHGNEQLTCSICNLKFKCKRYLKKHTRSHEGGIRSSEKEKIEVQKGISVRKLSCKECPKTFMTSDCLYQHTKNCHGTQVQCELCNSKLKSVTYLNSHMRRVHYNDGKKHKCKLCFKEFKSPRQLSIHMRNVHPHILHPCPHCKRLFSKIAQLKTHLNHSKCMKKSDLVVKTEVKVEVLESDEH